MLTFLQKKKRLLAGLLLSIFVLGALFSTVPTYAYSFDEYEEFEGKYRVDNSHNSPSHVNLYILSEPLRGGYFSYNFYQTDGLPHYNGATVSYLIYFTRAENLKEVKTFDDGSKLYMVTFGIENGKYVFSNNFCVDTTTLTPDYKNPQKLNPVGEGSASAYLDSYTEHFVDVSDETINVYCSLGDANWVDEHLNNLITYAKEKDGVAVESKPVDSSDADEIRQALAEAGYDDELLDDFLTELEKAENEPAIPETENAETESVVVPMEPVETVQSSEVEEAPEASNFLGWVITIGFFIGFFGLWGYQKKKKEE